MVYQAELKKIEKKKRWKNLLELWHRCESFSEFRLKETLESLDATWFELACFRLHWLKKEHFALYALWWICTILFFSVLSPIALILLTSLSVGMIVVMCIVPDVAFISVLGMITSSMMEIEEYERFH